MPIEDDVESCGSRASDSSSSQANSRHHRQKLDVYNEVLRRIQESNFHEANLPGFDDQLWLHFNRLPARYALDVNVDRAEDVLMHKRLLQLAVDPANRPAFDVRSVQVYPSTNENFINSSFLDSSMTEDAQSSLNYSNRQGNHPPPTFGSSPNLEAFAIQACKYGVEDRDSALNMTPCFSRPMYEITFATIDKPKLLSEFVRPRQRLSTRQRILLMHEHVKNELTCFLADVGLNIQEAHAFSSVDGFSLDAFVIDGWPYEETEELKRVLEKEILTFKEQCWSEKQPSPALGKHNQNRVESFPCCVEIPTDGTDVWEIDTRQLKFENKVGSGSYGDLYRGTYCSQEVAIKVLRPERLNEEMVKEFSQEVYIMRKVRHKNVVQFIGACTKPPNLCIVTEFMSRGSLYDFLHKQRGVFNLPSLLKVAINISRGMNYLHQNNIIHRDLKTANLLMDENMVVKVADFGVARVQTQSGVMTAETGTYRWMAPEVIEHKPYDHKVDVFSFGIALWELLTGEIPYSSMTPLQAAVGVVQKRLRPTIPKNAHPVVAELLERCWRQDPTERPNFSEILEILKQIAEQVKNNGENRRKKDKISGAFFSAFKREHH